KVAVPVTLTGLPSGPMGRLASDATTAAVMPEQGVVRSRVYWQDTTTIEARPSAMDLQPVAINTSLCRLLLAGTPVPTILRGVCVIHVTGHTPAGHMSSPRVSPGGAGPAPPFMLPTPGPLRRSEDRRVGNGDASCGSRM